ncbi:hypothetical protein B0F90DRAFT_1817089 [Multifurca ochricompacta]|uniref:Uncharacterized protein n=1 Tax=Multifurca ochricompacta TaxID=376703 RepID=A0AAD4QMJ7_9AGAM|nr:hypothetical protein B0F90DRAFT_1817089 [Multifurca ochricompacta]
MSNQYGSTFLASGAFLRSAIAVPNYQPPGPAVVSTGVETVSVGTCRPLTLNYGGTDIWNSKPNPIINKPQVGRITESQAALTARGY